MPTKKPAVRKTVAKNKVAPISAAKKHVFVGKYFEGVGRRKTAIARVRIVPDSGYEAVINEKSINAYFPLARWRETALAPLNTLKIEKMGVSVKVSGGGIAAQAEAIRHGLSRALASFDSSLTKKLRLLGFLTRDSRMVERKKYGLKKARRAPQWAKR